MNSPIYFTLEDETKGHYVKRCPTVRQNFGQGRESAGSEAEIQLQNRNVTVSAYTNQLTLSNLQL
jgi:hypothetical protein